MLISLVLSSSLSPLSSATHPLICFRHDPHVRSMPSATCFQLAHPTSLIPIPNLVADPSPYPLVVDDSSRRMIAPLSPSWTGFFYILSLIPLYSFFNLVYLLSCLFITQSSNGCHSLPSRILSQVELYTVYY